MFFKDAHFNPFVAQGSNGVCIDDFSVETNDFGEGGFIAGSYFRCGNLQGEPIRSASALPGTPSWGAEWKRSVGEWYGHTTASGSHGSCMSYASDHLDLDPTYTDRHRLPMMRLTFNGHDNDLRLNQYMKAKVEGIAQEMQPDHMASGYAAPGAQYDVRPYQSTHNTGGHIMSETAEEGAVNRYCQAWDKHNVFVMGAGNFVQNTQYNPTGLVGALACWTLDAIRTQYLSNPRPLV